MNKLKQARLCGRLRNFMIAREGDEDYDPIFTYLLANLDSIRKEKSELEEQIEQIRCLIVQHNIMIIYHGLRKLPIETFSIIAPFVKDVIEWPI